MRKIISIILICALFVTLNVSASAQSSNTTFNSNDRFIYEASSFKEKLADIIILKSDGTPLKNSMVQLYSYFDGRDVFVGMTDENGRIELNYLPDLNVITEHMKKNKLDVLDMQYAVISGDNEEVVIDGLTKSYNLKDSKIYTDNLNRITKSFKTEKIKNKTKSFFDNEKSIMRTTVWHLAGTKDLGNQQTKIGHINICHGVTGSASIQFGTTYSLSGAGVVSVTLTQSSSQSYGLTNMTSLSGYRYNLYSTFHYVEELWVSDVGEMYKVRADSFNGGLTKAGTYEPNNNISYSTACTKPNVRIMGSPGYYDRQVSEGVSVSGAATLNSKYIPSSNYTIGLEFQSTYSQSFHIDLDSTYSQYCIYDTNDYIVHN